MRFSFLITILAFGGLLLGGAAYSDALSAEVPPHQFIPDDPAFETVLRAYKTFNSSKAIRLTQELIRQRKEPEIAKMASFLLGDLYYDIAESGHPLDYKHAISAFQRARAKYTESEEAATALLKIGTIYLKQRLFYEALASFNRTLKKYPERHLAVLARFGKAQVYFTWKKYQKAVTEYDLIDPRKLKGDEKVTLLLGYGDTFRQLNMPNTAYRYYKLVPVKNPRLRKFPDTIFQYGIAALHSEDYKRAIKLFEILQDRYPGGPDSLLALARIGDAWRMRGMSHRAKDIYRLVIRSHKRNTNGQLAKIAAAVGMLHLAGCSPRPILVSEADCHKMDPLNSKRGLAALEKITQKAEKLFSDLERPGHFTRPRLLEQILLSSMEALEQHGAYTLSLQLKERFLEKKLHKKTRKKLEASLKQTVLQASEQLLLEPDNIPVLIIFFRHREQFSESVLKGSIGLQLGIRLTESGFYHDAVPILKGLTDLKTNRHSEEALYYFLKASHLSAAYSAAAEGLPDYIKRYPKSQRMAELQIYSAEISTHEGKITEAIQKYRTWLLTYPGDHRAEQVRLALARSHEAQGALKSAIALYLKLLPGKASKTHPLQIKVADLYFQLKAYKKARTYYEESLQDIEEGPQKEWIQVQLANIYTETGQTKKGRPLFVQLAKQAEDDIIQGFARQKITSTGVSGHE